MIITLSEAQKSLSKYIKLCNREDIMITEDGHMVAILTKPIIEKKTILESLVGIIPDDIDISEIKGKRLMDKS